MFKKLFNKLVYIEDDEFSKFDRRWKREIAYGVFKGDPYIGFQTRLVQFGGEPRDLIVKLFYLNIVVNPKKWKICQNHVYYDGPNCSWQFGPIEIHRCGNWCNKCCVEES